MLNKFSFFCILLLSCNTHPKKLDCTKFKTGRFVLRLKSNNKIFAFTLLRHNSVQTEINELTGDTTKYKIIWIDDCNYELKFLKTTENLPDSSLRLKKSMTITTSILETKDNYYLFQSKSDKSNYTFEDTIWTKD